MATNLIQGKDAVLSFFKNSYIPVVCSTDCAIAITADTAPTRSVGSGPWKKFNYQALSYTLTLSGLLKFDNANWTGWDMLDNQVGFSQIKFQLTFTDDAGNVRSIRGTAVINTHTTVMNVANLVKQDFNMTGSGGLMIFDGLVPCDTDVTSITVTGQTAADGIVHIAYAYTGAVYQVKYRIDSTGDYIYALAGFGLVIPGLSVEDHSIEIIPVCVNGYEGTGLTQPFIVTQALVCSTVISNITIGSVGSSQVATAVYTGAATQMRYRIEGGPWINSAITSSISVGGLPVGAHTIEMVPICSNGALGSGFVKSFTISSQPAQSIINYSFIFTGISVGTKAFYIYVNGVLTINTATPASGSITVPTGAVVTAGILCDPPPLLVKHLTLLVVDASTSTTLYNNTIASPNYLPFTWTANGDTYSVTETISD